MNKRVSNYLLITMYMKCLIKQSFKCVTTVWHQGVIPFAVAISLTGLHAERPGADNFMVVHHIFIMALLLKYVHFCDYELLREVIQKIVELLPLKFKAAT